MLIWQSGKFRKDHQIHANIAINAYMPCGSIPIAKFKFTNTKWEPLILINVPQNYLWVVIPLVVILPIKDMFTP
jgi:hypothetical protein